MVETSLKPSPSLKNIGLQSTAWLAQVGIQQREELEAIGAVEAYLRVKHAFPDRVSLNLLYALQALLLNVRWNELPAELKAELRAQVEPHER